MFLQESETTVNLLPKDWAFWTAFFEAGSVSAQSLFVLWLSPTNENFTTLFAYKKPTILVSFWYLKQVFSRLFQYLCLSNSKN